MERYPDVKVAFEHSWGHKVGAPPDYAVLRPLFASCEEPERVHQDRDQQRRCGARGRRHAGASFTRSSWKSSARSASCGARTIPHTRSSAASNRGSTNRRRRWRICPRMTRRGSSAKRRSRSIPRSRQCMTGEQQARGSPTMHPGRDLAAVFGARRSPQRPRTAQSVETHPQRRVRVRFGSGVGLRQRPAAGRAHAAREEADGRRPRRSSTSPAAGATSAGRTSISNRRTAIRSRSSSAI